MATNLVFTIAEPSLAQGDAVNVYYIYSQGTGFLATLAVYQGTSSINHNLGITVTKEEAQSLCQSDWNGRNSL